MLSRVAGSLYWMGRYLERAENVTRLLRVTSETSVEFEGLDEKLAQAEWDDLVRALPGTEAPAAPGAQPGDRALPYVAALLLHDSQPTSVRHALAMARENARAIREALTREIFVQLNRAYHDLAALADAGVGDAVTARDALVQTHRTILTTLGAMEHTLSRDEGWTFLKLGEVMERTQRTLSVLRAKLPALRGRGEGGDLPLFYARWRALLRCVASLENFRRVYGAGLEPDAVIRFLLFDPSAPRSVRCGMVRATNYLAQLPEPPTASAARRIAGRLAARLSYEDDAIMESDDLVPFCDATLAQLSALHVAIGQQYFPV